MADVPRAAEETHTTPRWVKVFGVIALVLVLLLVIGLLTGRVGPGGHGPGRHTATGDAGGHTAASRLIVTETDLAIHAFALGDGAMEQEHADEMAGTGDGMAHTGPNNITLPLGETKQLT